MQQPFGTSQETRLIPALLPEYARIDDRTIRDLLAYIAGYARYIPFPELEDLPASSRPRNWYEFLQNNIAVILAQIWYLDAQEIDKKRQALVREILKIEGENDWLIQQVHQLVSGDPHRNNLIIVSTKVLSEHGDKKRGWVVRRMADQLGESRTDKWRRIFPPELERELIDLLLRIVLLEERLREKQEEEKWEPVTAEMLEQFCQDLEGLWADEFEWLYASLINALGRSDLVNGDLAQGIEEIRKLPEWNLEQSFLRQVGQIMEERTGEGDKIKKLRRLVREAHSSVVRNEIDAIINPEKRSTYAQSLEKLGNWLTEYDQRQAEEQDRNDARQLEEAQQEELKTQLWKWLERRENWAPLRRLFAKRLLRADLQLTFDTASGYDEDQLVRQAVGQILSADDRDKDLIEILEKLRTGIGSQDAGTPPGSMSDDEQQELLHNLLKEILNWNKEDARQKKIKGLRELSYDIAGHFIDWQKRLRRSTESEWRTSTEVEREVNHLMESLRPELRKIFSIEKGLEKNAEGRQLETLWRRFGEPFGLKKDEHTTIDHGESTLDSVVGVYQKFYNALVRIQGIVPRYFTQVLTQKHDHSPPMGILLTFVQLFRHLQDHLNTLTRSHLEFYFEEVLGFRPLPAKPDEVFVVLEPGEFGEQYTLPQGTGLLGVKDDRGIAPVYRTVEDLELSHVQIRELKTIFVSKNPVVDMGSNFELVSNILAAPKANSRDGRGEPFVGGQGEWALFGEGQLDKSEEERTMMNAEIGWLISSPVLFLQGGRRVVRLKFRFVEQSMANYRILMEDLCLQLPLDFTAIFDKVFHNSLRLQLSGAEGWIEVPDYQVTAPSDILDTEIQISFVMDPSDPAVTVFEPAVAETGFQPDAPLLKMTLGGKGFNYIYSFIRDLRIEKIFLEVEVSDVRNLDLYNNLGQLDSSLPFQPFGPVPIRGSYLAIGYPEIFRKKLTDIQFDIEWQNLPEDPHGFADHYAAYEKGWTNDTFEVQITALSNSRFYPEEGAPPIVARLFETEGSSPGRLCSKTRIAGINTEKLNIRPDYYLEPILNFDNDTRSGFFKMELTNPPGAFGHEAYPPLFTKIVTENAKPPVWRLFGKPKKMGAQLPLPNEPYTPVIQKISLSYTAAGTFNMAPLEAEERDTTAPEYFYHIHPFGNRLTYAKGRIFNTDLLTQLDQDGYLFIGLEGLKPPQPLNLYLELADARRGFTALEFPDIQWRYLSGDQWFPLVKDHILADGTNDFSRSGIIQLQIPADISLHNTILPGHLHWISVVAKGDLSLIGKVRLLEPHAVRAVWEPDPEIIDHFSTPLPPNNIAALENDLPAVNTVKQPFPSFGGRAPESRHQFYTRVSERLKHKGRGTTHSDIEQLVLEAFPEIGQVRCLSHLLYPEYDTFSGGNLIVVVAPKITLQEQDLEPRVNVHLLNDIKNFLEKRVSPFTQINVRNPQYEKIKVNCEMIFIDKARSGAYIQQLNRELNEYLAPWLFGSTTTLKFGGGIRKEAVINFIEQRPYVRFVTRFSMIQIIEKQEEYYLVRDTAQEDELVSVINAYTPWSVLIPFERHQFSSIDEEAYRPSETSSIENISVGVDFIIRDTETEKELYEKRGDEKITVEGYLDEEGEQPLKTTEKEKRPLRLKTKFDPKDVHDRWF